MAHVLFLTPQLPYPPMQGTSLRNWHIMRGVAAEHQVSLLSFSEHKPAYVAPQLAAISHRVETVAEPPGRSMRVRLMQAARDELPDLAHRLTSSHFSTALQRRLISDPPDIVQIEGLEMAGSIPLIRQVSPLSRIVYDAHNAETQLQRRAYDSDRNQLRRLPAAAFSWVQIDRLARYEAWAVATADAVVAVSDVDAAELRRLPGVEHLPITVIANSIDLAEYSAVGTVAQEQRFDLVFSGKMDYRPNVDGVLWFAENVWPQLRARYPTLTWAIVGQRPLESILALREQPGVTVTGRVETIQPYLAGSKVNIIPLRMGSGTRLKLIEAMASASAVVSTQIGAEGFPVEDGRNIMLADSADAFARSISTVLDDNAQRLAFGHAARQFAELYDWRHVSPRFNALYTTLL